MAFFRENTVENPRYSAVWRGPVAPTLILVHSETVAKVLKTSGINPVHVELVTESMKPNHVYFFLSIWIIFVIFL